MSATRATHEPLLTPEQVGTLVIQPLGTESVAGRVATYVPTGQSAYRLPVVKSDPDAEWVDPLEEIPLSEAEVDEVATDWKKLAALTLLSNDLLDDSDDAGEQIGAGIVRDQSIKLDQAFFGTRGSNTKRPEGLEDLDGTSIVMAGAAWADVDPFNAAIFGASGAGRQITSFVANPKDALTLANLKESSSTGTRKGLLQPDPTQPARLLIAGVPLETSPAVTEGVIWGLPKSVCYVVVREDGEVELDRSAAFTRDGAYLRSKLRVDFLFPHPAAIMRIQLATP